MILDILERSVRLLLEFNVDTFKRLKEGFFISTLHEGESDFLVKWLL